MGDEQMGKRRSRGRKRITSAPTRNEVIVAALMAVTAVASCVERLVH